MKKIIAAAIGGVLPLALSSWHRPMPQRDQMPVT